MSGSVHDPAIIVTFDDGYSDTLSTAKGLLEQFQVPATVFIPTGCVGSAREFWWDALEQLLLTPGRDLPTLAVTIGGREYEWSFPDDEPYDTAVATAYRTWRAWEGGPTPRHVAYRELWSLLGPLDERNRMTVLDELFAAAGLESKARESHRLLREPEVLQLIEGGLIRLGSHTVTHAMLSSQSLDEQRFEIQSSKTSIEALTQRPVTTFAYPFGQKVHYTTETAAIVRDAGFACACANFPGLMTNDTDRFEIPRLQMHDYDGEEFDRVIDQWLES